MLWQLYFPLNNAIIDISDENLHINCTPINKLSHHTDFY